MKIVFTNHGFGNQIYQYIFYRFMEEYSNDYCCIDDSFIQHVLEDGYYELKEVFKVKPHLLSDSFDSIAWKELIQITNPRSQSPKTIVDYLKLGILSEGNSYARLSKYLYDFTPELKLYGDNFIVFPQHKFSYKVANISGNFYCCGIWGNPQWMHPLSEKILEELKFPPIPIKDKLNTGLMDAITSSSSVGIHVRRGDYADMGVITSATYYTKAVEHIKEIVLRPTFFVFSDDIPWCKENQAAIGIDSNRYPVYFVEGNTGRSSFRDMQLMSHCKNLITPSFSTFSQCAYLLNRNPNKFIISVNGVGKL